MYFQWYQQVPTVVNGINGIRIYTEKPLIVSTIYQVVRLKGDIMAKKIWVQFKDMKSYRENEVRLCTLLRKAPGECTAFVYIRDIKKIRELHTYSFDEKQIELLNDAFGV